MKEDHDIVGIYQERDVFNETFIAKRAAIATFRNKDKKIVYNKLNDVFFVSDSHEQS